MTRQLILTTGPIDEPALLAAVLFVIVLAVLLVQKRERLSRGEGLARLLRLDKMFRLKVLPISLALPWVINIGDMAGHFPLPAKISVRALKPIRLREEFGFPGTPIEISVRPREKRRR